MSYRDVAMREMSIGSQISVLTEIRADLVFRPPFWSAHNLKLSLLLTKTAKASVGSGHRGEIPR